MDSPENATITCSKDRSKLIFTRKYDGRKAVYDLADSQCYNFQGRKVKSLNSFFVNQYLSDLYFAEEPYRLFVDRVRANNGRIRNVGTMLSLLYQFRHNEDYYLQGINIRFQAKVPLNHYSKPVIKFLKSKGEHSYNLGSWMSFFENDEDDSRRNLLVNMIQVEPFTEFFEDLSIQNFRSIHDLVMEYNMKPKALLLKICEYVRAEGIQLSNVIRNLNDYNRMSKAMTSKYTKYPKYLLSMHNIVQKNYNSFREYYEEQEFRNSVNDDLAHKGVTYSILTPQLSKDIQQEGADQNHCVASYVRSVMKGHTQIVFMRTNKELEKSLLTIEVKNGELYQAKGKSNRAPTEEEMKFIMTYAKAKELKVGRYL